MGQKVHPTGIRLGIVKDWNSTWYADSSNFADFLHKDLEVRKYLLEELKTASVSHIRIERLDKNAKLIIRTARPGIVIGKRGEDIERLRNIISKMMGVTAQVSIEEIRKPELEAILVAQNIASQIERRIMFRRAIKRAVTNTMRVGAKGIKVNVSGRLNGVEIARSEWYREGRVPLHTLRADIDYGVAEASTTYGVIGIKVWIFKGEVVPTDGRQAEETKAATGKSPSL